MTTQSRSLLKHYAINTKMELDSVIILLVPVVGSVRGCVEPCIRSMLSKTVSEDQKGECSLHVHAAHMDFFYAILS